MNISIFGLGYVGAVSAACLADLGHRVIGVDISDVKVNLINSGRSPVIESGLDALVRKGIDSKNLRATRDANFAVASSELTFICVGTPSRPSGEIDLSHLVSVASDIGKALKSKQTSHIIVVRSTALPGSVRGVVVPAIEKFSGKKAGTDFFVGSNPEFLREGTAVADFYTPPKTVVGAADAATAEKIAAIYSSIDGGKILTSIEIAEMAKYSDNIWHALKVTFANEIGSTCKAMGINSHEVLNIFSQDTKLNLSSYYLKPGFAFGGSCLPKDVRALTHAARSRHLHLPVLEAILPSNNIQITRGLDLIKSLERKPICFLGITFKAGTDDVRESPLLDLVARLLMEGYELKIFDRNIDANELIGANREYLLKTIPNIFQHMVGSLDDALAFGKIVVVGNADPEFLSMGDKLAPHHKLVDLVNVQDHDGLNGRYFGINW